MVGTGGGVVHDHHRGAGAELGNHLVVVVVYAVAGDPAVLVEGGIELKAFDELGLVENALAVLVEVRPAVVGVGEDEADEVIAWLHAAQAVEILAVVRISVLFAHRHELADGGRGSLNAVLGEELGVVPDDVLVIVVGDAVKRALADALEAVEQGSVDVVLLRELLEVTGHVDQRVLSGPVGNVGEARADDVGHRLRCNRHVQRIGEVAAGKAGVDKLIFILNLIQNAEELLVLGVAGFVSGVEPELDLFTRAGGGRHRA